MAKKQSSKRPPGNLNAAACALLAASRQISQARGLVDVLSELVAPGGDANTGAIALQQLGPGSLYTTLSLLNDLLLKAEEHVTDSSIEVAHG